MCHYVLSFYFVIIGMPSLNNMSRRVNHKRKLMRPDDPRQLEFDLSVADIGADFLKGDIWVEGKRHIILASDYQMQLLSTARHWLV